MAGRISDSDRKKLEAAIAAAILLIYKGKAREALDRLGKVEQQVKVSPAQAQKINDFARARAALVQTGINMRLANATSGLPDDASPDQQQLATGQVKNEVATYNAQVLQPFLISWASHQALIDTYQDTPDPNGSGTSAADATLWQWTQLLNYSDECEEADALGPASLDDIYAITSGPPPIHPSCACQLGPA